MPRKPKIEKHTMIVVVNGAPITVTMHPPRGPRRSWYVYWAGLVASRSTGQAKLEDAIVVAETMIKNGGKTCGVADVIMSDEEFKSLQQHFYGRKTDPAALARANSTLKICLASIDAFKLITGLDQIVLATSDVCAAFQRKALTLPRNWRRRLPSQSDVATLNPNTVIRWSTALTAAFERANRNAGKKCVRGVVSEKKLLNENPWKQFTWIDGRKRVIRQFDSKELLSFLDYLEGAWSQVKVAAAAAKVFLWSWCRRTEVVELKWDSLRIVGDEYHFDIVGKAAIEKWFRIPKSLHEELLQMKTKSPYVFAAWNDQLRAHHARPGSAARIGKEYRPYNFGDWFHARVVEWSADLPKGHATPHVFRKTSLQYARSGEDLNRLIANDARLTTGVMMTNYVKETDEQMRQKSNRMFHRILASLDPKVAQRYGQAETAADQLKERLMVATAAEDWATVAALTAELLKQSTRRSG